MELASSKAILPAREAIKPHVKPAGKLLVQGAAAPFKITGAGIAATGRGVVAAHAVVSQTEAYKTGMVGVKATGNGLKVAGAALKKGIDVTDKALADALPHTKVPERDEPPQKGREMKKIRRPKLSLPDSVDGQGRLSMTSIFRPSSPQSQHDAPSPIDEDEHPGVAASIRSHTTAGRGGRARLDIRR